eukprot:RCo031878
MPLTPAFTWEQSETQVTLTVQLIGVHPDKVDVYTTDSYVKVNADQRYLLTVDLFSEVVHEKTSSRKFPDGRLGITLWKAQEGLVWPNVRAEGDPGALKKRRQESITRAEQSYATRLQQRSSTQTAEEKRYFTQGWDLEKAQRKQIEERVRR